MAKIGKVVQVIGPVVDVEFDENHLPAIYNAVRIVDGGKETGIPVDVICEVQQHLGENRVRTVAMEPTDLITIRKDDFYYLVATDPPLGMKLLWAFIQVLSYRLRSANQELTQVKALVAKP